jgi:hypothetical protein
VEAALARRREVFALSHLAWNADGYTVKFRLGIIDIVRTGVAEGVLEDEGSARMDRMLDEVRRHFLIFGPGPDEPSRSRQADEMRGS